MNFILFLVLRPHELLDIIHLPGKRERAPRRHRHNHLVANLRRHQPRRFTDVLDDGVIFDAGHIQRVNFMRAFLDYGRLQIRRAQRAFLDFAAQCGCQIIVVARADVHNRAA